MKVMPEMGALYGPQFMLQQRNKSRIGVIEKTSDVLDVYFMFSSSSGGAPVMRAAHIALDLAGIATGDIPPLQRFVSLRPAMGLKYINVKKISVLLDRFLGKGQYYMLSHYDLQQNQKATSAFPANFLHQNKQRMLMKTDEARETVLALKRLFEEAGFLPCERDKSLAQAPPLPRTSPIYHYLLFALGVTPQKMRLFNMRRAGCIITPNASMRNLRRYPLPKMCCSLRIKRAGYGVTVSLP
ncbi:MAG: hypothetical protein ACMX3H_01355 [Sodalis sp. (in: enterobacteria)]